MTKVKQMGALQSTLMPPRLYDDRSYMVAISNLIIATHDPNADESSHVESAFDNPQGTDTAFRSAAHKAVERLSYVLST